MNEPTTTKKICESCRKEFSCGAQSAKCWCFDVDLTAETLSKLRKDFENCLCENCLEKSVEFNEKLTV